MRVAQEGGSIGSGCLRQCTLQQDPIISNRSRSGSITSKVGTGESSKLDHTELLGGTIPHHTIRQEQNTVNSIVSHRMITLSGMTSKTECRSFDLGKKGHVPGKSQLGKSVLELSADTERPAGASLSRTPWTSRVVEEGIRDMGSTEKARSARSCLPKVHCHCKKKIVALKQQQAIVVVGCFILFGSSHH